MDLKDRLQTTLESTDFVSRTEQDSVQQNGPCHRSLSSNDVVRSTVCSHAIKTYCVVVKVKNRLDATKYVVFIAPTCFGHQYAHHQEYN
jgi:hypothetical protein